MTMHVADPLILIRIFQDVNALCRRQWRRAPLIFLTNFVVHVSKNHNPTLNRKRNMPSESTTNLQDTLQVQLSLFSTKNLPN